MFFKNLTLVLNDYHCELDDIFQPPIWLLQNNAESSTLILNVTESRSWHTYLGLRKMTKNSGIKRQIVAWQHDCDRKKIENYSSKVVNLRKPNSSNKIISYIARCEIINNISKNVLPYVAPLIICFTILY